MSKTKMEKNYRAGMNVESSLVKNVDNLRTCIKDLYDLDEDNYKCILNHADCLTNHADNINYLRSEVDRLQKLSKKLSDRIARNRAKAVFGFLGVIGLGWLAYEGINEILKRVQKRIESLEDRIEIEEFMKDASAEESDG